MQEPVVSDLDVASFDFHGMAAQMRENRAAYAAAIFEMSRELEAGEIDPDGVIFDSASMRVMRTSTAMRRARARLCSMDRRIARVIGPAWVEISTQGRRPRVPRSMIRREGRR